MQPAHRNLCGFAQFTLAAFTLCGASSAHASPIFRCEVNGAVTFADRPCADDAAEYVPDDQRVSTVTVEPTVQRAKPPANRKRSASAAGSIAADQLRHKEDCARIKQSLTEIRSKMRAGYTTEEGERLKDRQRGLTVQWRSMKCK